MSLDPFFPLGIVDPVVTPHALYGEMAGSAEDRLVAYRALFEDRLSTEVVQRLRDCTNGGFVLGSPRFERHIAAMVGRWTWKGSPGRPPKDEGDGEQGELAV